MRMPATFRAHAHTILGSQRGSQDQSVKTILPVDVSAMPALEAFGTKFHIGSDDLVFPNLFLLCIRFIW